MVTPVVVQVQLVSDRHYRSVRPAATSMSQMQRVPDHLLRADMVRRCLYGVGLRSAAPEHQHTIWCCSAQAASLLRKLAVTSLSTAQ